MDAVLNVFSAFGLSSAAGLNAYLPLLVVALVARYTDWITLRPPFDALTHPAIIALLVVLLLIEMTVDKIPALDSVNDVIHTIIRPAAGAILFAASNNVISNINPVLAMALGILAAGTMHTAKATARPVVTGATFGIGNPIVSLVEDVISLTITLLAILMPIFIALFLVAFIAWWWNRRLRRSVVA